MQTAETTNFMILGLAFVFIPMLLHIGSLYMRFQNLKKDQQLLEELED